MCESEPAILSAIIVLLTIFILLLLYLLTEKICLSESNSSFLSDNNFYQLCKLTVKSYETPLSVER